MPVAEAVASIASAVEALRELAEQVAAAMVEEQPMGRRLLQTPAVEEAVEEAIVQLPPAETVDQV